MDTKQKPRPRASVHAPCVNCTRRNRKTALIALNCGSGFQSISADRRPRLKKSLIRKSSSRACWMRGCQSATVNYILRFNTLSMMAVRGKVDNQPSPEIRVHGRKEQVCRSKHHQHPKQFSDQQMNDLQPYGSE
jgi:hypothetical protein